MKLLIKGGQVLLTRPEPRLISADLCLEEGNISSVGAPPPGFVPDRILNAAGKLVMPGLLNCHTHAYMSVFRGYADDLPFREWLFDKIMPAEDALTPQDAYWCNLLSCLEMIRTGTTTFADMHMFGGQSVAAARQSGLRAVIGRGLVGDTAEDPAGSSRLAEAFGEMEEAKGCGRITFRLAPHAIYTCGEGFLRHLAALAREKGLGIHIHVAEGRQEVDDCLARHGATPVAYLNRLGLFDAPTLAAHCVHLTEEDLSILAEKRVSVATNPVSNLKLGNGVAPVAKLLGAGVNVCVGTDGASSNNVLNMFRELGVLSLLHKGVEGDSQCLPASQTLLCGTANAGAALGLNTGYIESGMAADLLLLDLSAPWLHPRNDPVSALIYGATGAEVDTVIVDGQVLLEGGRFLTLDQERIYAEMDRIRKTYLG